MSPSDLVRPSERFKQLLADPRLRERFLPPMTEEETAAVERLLDPVVCEVQAWCSDSPILNPDTAVPLAFLTIAPFPYLSAEAAALRIKAATWTYALDDIIDGDQLPFSELVPALRECLTLSSVRDDRSSYRSNLARDLLRVKNEFERYPLFPLVQPFWASSLARLIDAMIFEHWAAATAAHCSCPPDFDHYLYYARHSIANAHLMVAATIVEEDSSIVAALPELFDLAEHCAEAIRLSNDLVTYKREVAEGRANALAIKIQELSRTLPDASEYECERVAAQWLRSQIEVVRSEANQHGALVAGTTPIARRFTRAMDLAVDLYLLGDYREWAQLVGAAGIR